MTTKAERKKQRRLEAEARRTAREKRSDAEQLALIQGRRGSSSRETQKLSKRIMGEE